MNDSIPMNPLFKLGSFIIPDLDVGEGWTLDSDDEELGGGMSCYGEDDAPPSLSEETAAAASSNKETVTLHVDRKTSTGSTVSC